MSSSASAMLSCALDRTAASSVASPPPPSPSGVACPCFSSHRRPRRPAIRRVGSPLSFGTRRHMTGDPMLLMLGDHIYRSTHEQGTSCVRQHVRHPNLGMLPRAQSVAWASCRPCRHLPLHCRVVVSPCCPLACPLRCSSFSRLTMADRSWRPLMCTWSKRASRPWRRSPKRSG